ncbi:unnamed protein product [Peniophora sp. CBMAI 1063]|nr:unnamed protein product [Peniophora sp. CBMAI 1063]
MSDAAALLPLLRQVTALQDMTLIFAGMCWHEFISNIEYDWKLLRRQEIRRPMVAHIAQWTYMLCRVIMVVYGCCIFTAAFPIPGGPDCHVLLKILITTNVLGIMCSSTLLSIRVGAIWKWSKRIVALLVMLWCIILAFAIYFVVKVQSTYEAVLRNCSLDGVHNDLYPSIAMLICDCTLLTLLLVGLQINWRNARQFEMWNALWQQGLAYLFLATLIEVPVVTLLSLDINPIMNSMFVSPEAIILPIGATRMFRSLNAAVHGSRSKRIDTFTTGATQDMTLVPREVELQALRRR